VSSLGRSTSLPPAADQVRFHGQGRLELFVDDLVEDLAPDRQVGVTEIGTGVEGEPGRHQIGPSPVGAVRVWIIETFGKAVAYRHEAAPGHPAS
jgi:hypothetical protein